MPNIFIPVKEGIVKDLKTVKSVAVKRKVLYIPITSLFDKRQFHIDNYGTCKNTNNKFITLKDKKDKRVVTFIATVFPDGNTGVYRRNVIFYSYDNKIDHNKEVIIYGRKFIVLDKKTKRGDNYVIKADSHRLVGFCNELKKVIKFVNVCL